MLTNEHNYVHNKINNKQLERVFDSMEFEWDNEKNNTNIEKHGIDFADVGAIFDNPVLEFEDDRKDYGEKRFFGIGIVKDLEISVAYTKRKNNIRMISARRARKDERQKYRSLFSKHSS